MPFGQQGQRMRWVNHPGEIRYGANPGAGASQRDVTERGTRAGADLDNVLVGNLAVD